MYVTRQHIIVWNKLQCKHLAEVATLRSTVLLLCILFVGVFQVHATNYLVATKADLQTRMSNAIPGDTVTVVNGTYNFGQINFTNSSSVNASPWIVLKPQSFNGVTFTGNTYLQFAGRRIHITGFRFASGNSGSNDVIQFRSSSSVLAHYCRISHITIDNYNSDSTGSVLGNSPDIDNKWISLYGTNNRVDHCTFINKFNAGATVTVWFNNNNYPQPSTSTFHLIDSNYFNGRGYLGENGGETIRIGTSSTSRTNGYNIIEYNLFENCIQTEPEIISNKSNFNFYRYNTFKNCNGGLTLRHGRFCSVFGNFFIVDNATRTRSYGVRVIDKGHRVFNNYFEGLRGNSNSLTSLRCPIILYNGAVSTNDTTNVSFASGYFSADSTIVAFNTIVNCNGGAGVVMGFTDGGNLPFEAKGILLANNLIRMTTGQAAYLPPANTQTTFSAEGNIFQAPNGAGLTTNIGFTNQTLNFGSRQNGVLQSPALAQDAAINSSNYNNLISGIDVFKKNRSTIFDVGAIELNSSGSITNIPLDSTLVGAGKPNIVLPVKILSFTAVTQQEQLILSWHVANEINLKHYEVEYATNGNIFTTAGIVPANQQSVYNFSFHSNLTKQYYLRLKLVDTDGSFSYSNIIVVTNSHKSIVKIFPNPASTAVQFSVNEFKPNTIIQILNAAGKIVDKVQLFNTTVQYNCSKLFSGTYTVQVLQQQQIIQSFQLIVIK